jgi:hypothetical protein
MFSYKLANESNSDIIIYEYDGSLEDDLLSIGIPLEHINKMRSALIQPPLPYYCIYGKKTTYLVPLTKVVCFGRGDIGHSVFENVVQMYSGDREAHRFSDCFSYINAYQDLDTLYKSYETLFFPVEMQHYVENDTFYLSGDGNHRTLIAKLLNAPFILANVTEVNEDFEKHKRYDYVNAMFSKYHITRIYSDWNDISFCVEFKDGNTLYNVMGYDDELSISDSKKRIHHFEVALKKDLECVEKIKHMPKFLHKSILRKQKYQVQQLFNHKYTDISKRIPSYSTFYLY